MNEPPENDPLVSVVIPVFNGEAHLAECLSSVLNQTYRNIEVVLAEDLSVDRSNDIIQGFADPRIRRLPTLAKRITVHDNWERALAAARGEFIKLVCQDDALAPECVAVQTRLMCLYPQAALASCRRTIIDARGNVLIKERGLGRLCRHKSPRIVTGREVARACARAGTNLLGEPGSVLFRRSSLPQPLLNPKWEFAMDLDLYFRCLDGEVAVLDREVLAYFRVSAHQLSADLAGQQAREIRDFFVDVAHRAPGTLNHFHLGMAAVKSLGLAYARKWLYRQDNRRSYDNH